MNSHETYDEFARPGDPDFTAFPKQHPEDTVTYTIHLVPPHQLPPAEHRAQLNRISIASTKLSKSLFKDYIWQRDFYTLAFSETSPPYLQGTTCFGDSIADEWAIVYILRELSKQFDDAWIRVVDDDGQLLLVEAANVLPKWLEPDVAGHRVWINGGRVKIIPQSLSGQQKATTKTDAVELEDALSFIRDRRDALITSKQIEAEAFQRLRNYPTQIAESMHTTKVRIPRKLAYVLHRIPTGISPATEVFCGSNIRAKRSSQDLSITSDKSSFPPKDFVTVSVKFTRVGYAQLKGQNLAMSVKEREAYAASLTANAKSKEQSYTGMKMTRGFVLLLSDPNYKDSRVVREICLILEDVDSGDEALPTDEQIAAWPDVEEDEKWLDVDFEALERELGGRSSTANDKDGPDGAGFGDQNAQDNLKMIVERMQKLMQDEGTGSEGAEDYSDLDDPEASDEEDDNDDDDTEVSGEDKAGSFTDADFETAMKQMMGLAPDSTRSTNRIQELDDTEEPEFSTTAEDVHDDSNDNDDSQGLDIAAIQKLMASMEAELQELGDLDGNTLEGQPETGEQRYQIAKEMLEHLRSEAKQAGTAANPMTSKGVSLLHNNGG